MKVLLACALLFLSSCGYSSSISVTEDQAQEAANEHLAEYLPQMNLAELEIETVEVGEVWRVSYDFPEGSLGGPIFVHVSKQSGEVVDDP